MARRTIRVEQCWGQRLYYRLEWTGENGRAQRERIDAEQWDRTTAREALDLLENVYGMDRSQVRFAHH